MFVAGEHCDRETMEWTKKVFDCPVLDNWWQTGILKRSGFWLPNQMYK